jgi:peptide/nickel transport system permease protein
MRAMIQLHRQFWFWPLLLIAGLWLALLALPPLAGVKAVYLDTDKLIFLLVSGVLLLAGYIRSREHLRGPWRHIFRQRRAMIALVVLLFFIVCGLLDSVHFRKPLPSQGVTQQRYSVKVLSLLDILLDDMRRNVEKTYSAPLATHLFAKETVTLENGDVERRYVRLKYGGRDLTDPASQKWPNIRDLATRGVVVGAIIWLVLSAGLTAIFARRQRQPVAVMAKRVYRGDTDIPWRSIYLSLLLMLILLAVLLTLSTEYHVLGTDKVGQDVLYQSIKSIRTGLVIGTLTTLVMLPFAIVLGVMAGYFRSWVDDVIQYLYTTLSSIPGVLLIAAAILSIQVYIANHPALFETALDRADLRLLALCVILGITSWTTLCRLLRGETLKLREMEYIQAATALGVGQFTILGRHVLPNVMHIVLIIVVLDFSSLVLAEAVLSYIGVGVDPSTLSWGNMINGARLELARDPVVWWSLVAAFCLMFSLVLAANLFADAVRDAFDPRLREQG